MTAPAEVPQEPTDIEPQARPLEMTCPDCGGEARWWWRFRALGSGTLYDRIDCPTCDVEETP